MKIFKLWIPAVGIAVLMSAIVIAAPHSPRCIEKRGCQKADQDRYMDQMYIEQLSYDVWNMKARVINIEARVNGMRQRLGMPKYDPDHHLYTLREHDEYGQPTQFDDPS